MKKLPRRPARAFLVLAGLCLGGCRVDTDNLPPASERPTKDSGPADVRPGTPDSSPPLRDASPEVARGEDSARDPQDAEASPPETGTPPADLAPPPPPTPIDCQVGPFGPWSACSRPCDGGERSRSRPIVVPAMDGGAACPPLMEVAPCNLQGCPVDCEVGPWSDWSSCSKSCGGGEQTRRREVITPAANGGAACTTLAETRVCNPQAPNPCGGCGALPGMPGQDCGRCGAYVCAELDRLRCEDPGRTCEDLDATCGAPPDGCGGSLSCGGCADALSSCGPAFRCICGKPTALYSPSGALETGKRTPSPGGRWYATSDGVFAATGGQVAPLVDAKGFDWHPQIAGRFAVMYHFAPPDPLAVIQVLQIEDSGLARPVARGAGGAWHHAMAWIDGERLALGAPAECTTVETIRPQP